MSCSTREGDLAFPSPLNPFTSVEMEDAVDSHFLALAKEGKGPGLGDRTRDASPARPLAKALSGSWPMLAGFPWLDDPYLVLP